METQRSHFFRNTGKPFEQHVADIAMQYEQRGILALEKVDPPVRTVGTGAARKVIFQRNPHLDFVGTWIERGARALFIEAKSTDDERLAIGGTGNVRQSQVDALHRWAAHGAAVGILWEIRGQVRFISYERMRRALAANMKSLALTETVPVKQGLGFILYDFVENLRLAYPVV